MRLPPLPDKFSPKETATAVVALKSADGVKPLPSVESAPSAVRAYGSVVGIQPRHVAPPCIFSSSVCASAPEAGRGRQGLASQGVDTCPQPSTSQRRWGLPPIHLPAPPASSPYPQAGLSCPAPRSFGIDYTILCMGLSIGNFTKLGKIDIKPLDKAYIVWYNSYRLSE